jgi:hypothetical protein
MKGIVTFGRDEFAYGAALVQRELGGEFFTPTPISAKHFSAIGFSLFWWEHLYNMADWLRRAGLNKAQTKRPKLYAGGFVTYNPFGILSLCDSVCVGDGESVAVDLFNARPNESIVSDESRVRYNCCREVNAIAHETTTVTRIEIARGCKNKCKFCAVANHKPYRECSIESIKESISKANQKRVSLFAPETTQHSKANEIECAAIKKRLCRADTDVRLDNISKHSGGVPRVGIEGISHRLRKTIGKGYTNEMIIDAIKSCIARGIRGMHMYFILDLPSECEDDWAEFKELILAIGRLDGSDKFLLKPSPSVFLPTPHTPMSHYGINWKIDYGKKWECFFGRGDDRNWEVLMAERSRVFGGGQRILSMIATRAGLEFAQIEHDMKRQKAYTISSGRPKMLDIRKTDRILSRHGGIEFYTGERKQGPWDKVYW